MTRTDDRLTDDGLCFGCGEGNPIGLHLSFWWDGDTYYSRYTPQEFHQGWAGRTHGGILALTLDEVLSRAALTRHGPGWVTAELTTRLRRPAFTGTPLLIGGRIETVRRTLIVTVGTIVEETTGTSIADGRAKMMRVRQD